MTERITEIQQQHADALEDLKARMAAVERAEINLRKISVGPRGCQGVPGHNGEPGQRGERGNIGLPGQAGQNGRNGLDAEVSYDEVEARIIQILIDYKILSEAGPLKHFVEDKNFTPFAPPNKQ